MIEPPHPRRLTYAWVLLALLTISGLIGSEEFLGSLMPPLAVAALMMAIAGLKAWRVLIDYLNLRAVDRSWRALLAGYLIVLTTTILGAHAVAMARLA